MEIIMKIEEALKKTNDSFTVTICDNGFMLDIGGEDFEGNWKGVKLICRDEEELSDAIADIVLLPRN